MSKNNLIKRTLAIALAVVLTIGSAPLTGFIGMELPPIGSLFASAADEEIVWTVATADMLKIEDNTITGYTDKLSGNIEIPSSIDGVAITKIASSAFNGCSALTAVKIPGTITEIGYSSFQNCLMLETVYIDVISCEVTNPKATVELYEEYAPFSKNNKLTKFVFGTNVTTVPANLCLSVNNLSTVIFKNSGISIENYAFKSCSSLESIDLSGVKSIGTSAFKNCSSLSSVDLSNVKTIGASAFSGCSGITSVTLSESLETIGESAFEGCKMSEITIPENVKAIHSRAFRNCSKLKTINFNAIKCKITSYSTNDNFEGCESFNEIVFGENVTTIPEKVCEGADKLVTVTFKGNVTEIDSNAFRNCEALESIDFSNIKTIGSSAFENCNALTSIDLSDVNTINSSAFENCEQLNSVVYSNVKTIDSSAFANCKALTSIDLSDVNTIGSSAFSGCSGITSVTLSESLETIGDSAFKGCNITEITIPENVKTIGNYVFENCAKLKTIYFNANNCTIEYYNKDYINNYINCNSFNEIVFGENVTSIPAYVCRGATNLEKVTFNGKVNTINQKAFYNCTSLSDVYYNAGTQADWDKAVNNIGTGNDPLTNATVHFGKFTATFKINSDTITKVFAKGEDIVAPDESEYNISGYKVIGWEDSEGNEINFPVKMKNTDVEFTAILERTTYNVTIDVNGKIFEHKGKITGKVINAPAANEYDITGHKIVGWKDSDGNDVTFPYTVGEKDVTITAVIEKLSYTVTFNVYGESIVKNVKYGEAIEVPGNNDIDGCEITGWDKAIPETMPAKNLTFTATVNVEKVDSASDVSASFDGDCFQETDVQFKVTEETNSNSNGGLYIIDQTNPYKMRGTFNISMEISGQSGSKAHFNSGKKCTIKMPVPDYVANTENIVIIHPLQGADEVFETKSSKNKLEIITENGKKYFRFEVSSFSPFIIAESTNEATSVSIRNKSNGATVNYGDQLKLTAIVDNMPENAKLVWYVNGNPSDVEGETFTAPEAKGNFTVEVKLVDDDGKVLHNTEEKEISDSQSVTVKAGFFQKLISFFKNLFGLNRIIEQSF